MTDQQRRPGAIKSWGVAFFCLLTTFIAVSNLAAEDVISDGLYDLEIVAHQTPPAIEQWGEARVPLVLRNEGSITWIPGEFNVAYHWMSPQGDVLVLDGVRTQLPAEVRSGEEVSLEARLVAPKVSGQLLLQWDLVHENVTWFSDVDPTPPAAITVSVTPGVLTHGFTILDHETPRLMFAGQRRNVKLRLRNDGTVTWTTDELVNLSYHWNHQSPDKAVFDGERTSVPKEVGKADEVELTAVLRAPPAGGLYTLEWDMVHENVAWFAERDPTPAPASRIIVLPNPFRGARGSFVVALALLVFTAFAVLHPAAPAWLRAVASIADLLWLGSTLLLKQSSVLDEAGRMPMEGYSGVVASGVAAVTILVALLPRVIRPWFAVAVSALISLLILTDVVYLRFFGDVISISAAGAFGQTGQVRESIRELLTLRDLWLGLDLLPGIAIAILVLRLRDRTTRRPMWWLIILLAPVLIPGAVAVWKISDARRGKFVQVFQNVFIVQEIGILNFHVFDAWLELSSAIASEPVPAERLAEIESWFRSTAPRRAGSGPFFGAARDSNLLMIQVESLQSFVIGLEIEGQEVTPNLNRWRNAADVWSASCVDQTAQGRTSDGELVTQTSLLPLTTGAVAFRFGTNRYQAIGDILATRGYRTISAVPFHGAFWNRLVTHPEYGYQETLFDDAFEPGPRVGWGLNDRDFLRQMAPRLRALPRPFAVFMLTLSNHHPYADFPDELKKLDLGSWEGTSLGNYLHAMHLFDAGVAELLEQFDRDGLADRTVIALWGDHSAGLPWDDEHAAIMGVSHTEKNYYLVDEVPIFIRVPGTSLPERDTRCGQVDVAPTLLSLLGIDPAPYPFLGRNLFGAPAGPVVRRHGVWLDDELLYISKGPELEAGRCYEIESLERLPAERCLSGHTEARTQMAISRDIIIHDLHQPLTETLRSQQ